MKTIFTIQGYSNYGNRLQLFALNKVLKKFDNNVRVYKTKDLKRSLKEFLKYNTPLCLLYKKEAKLKKFTRKNISKEANKTKTGCSIVGSDQVWNPNWFKNQVYLLKIPNNDKKVAYAASMGVETLDDEQKKIFKDALKSYSEISVREKTAKALLQPLTDKKIEVVLDPTLLLDKDEYIKIEKKPKDLTDSERYVLCYILGDEKNQKVINDFAAENGWRVILFSDRRDSNYGVEEFLYLIHHAELVCTDSFHACVFSFIFEKPFVAFRRSGEADYMYSRLQNLIDTFHLKNREFNGKNITEENLKVDYTEGKKILKKEQEKSIKFLKNALGVEDE